MAAEATEITCDKHSLFHFKYGNYIPRGKISVGGKKNQQAGDNSIMNEIKYKKGISTLDKCQPHQSGKIYFRVRNAVAFISRYIHFVMSEMVEKSEKRRRREKI